MAKFSLTTMEGWIEVIATARYIVNSTAPGDCCYMSEDTIEAIKLLAEITQIQSLWMAKALIDAKKIEKDIEEAKEAQARV